MAKGVDLLIERPNSVLGAVFAAFELEPSFDLWTKMATLVVTMHAEQGLKFHLEGN